MPRSRTGVGEGRTYHRHRQRKSRWPVRLRPSTQRSPAAVAAQCHRRRPHRRQRCLHRCRRRRRRRRRRRIRGSRCSRCRPRRPHKILGDRTAAQIPRTAPNGGKRSYYNSLALLQVKEVCPSQPHPSQSPNWSALFSMFLGCPACLASPTFPLPLPLHRCSSRSSLSLSSDVPAPTSHPKAHLAVLRGKTAVVRHRHRRRARHRCAHPRAIDPVMHMWVERVLPPVARGFNLQSKTGYSIRSLPIHDGDAAAPAASRRGAPAGGCSERRCPAHPQSWLQWLGGMQARHPGVGGASGPPAGMAAQSVHHPG